MNAIFITLAEKQLKTHALFRCINYGICTILVPIILAVFATLPKKRLSGLFRMAHFLLIYCVEFFTNFN